MLGEIDEMVQKFLLSVRKKGGAVNVVVSRSVAKVLIKLSGKKELEVIDLDSRWWIQSLFRQMHFVRRTATISKVEIPKGTKKEAELTLLHRIVSTVEKYQILISMILNLDQTSLKYAPCSRKTLAPKNSKHVAISGTSKKNQSQGHSSSHSPFELIYFLGENYEKFAKIQIPKRVFIERKRKTFRQHSRVS